MTRKIIYGTIPSLLMALLLAVPSGCNKDDIPVFTAKSMLYIQQEDFIDGKTVLLADITRSFATYVDATEIPVTFTVNLIGEVTDYDRPFEAVVDEEVTTALPSEYEIEPGVLKAGEISAELTVKLIKSARMNDEKVRLRIRLQPNKYFDLGYEDMLTANVIYDNTPVCPEWWDEFISVCYLGPYTPEKYNAFYMYCGLTDISDMEPSELRELFLGFKEYIEKNGLKEADGSPMEVPVV